MATNVILPVLGMNQDTGKIIRWLKTEGQTVTKDEPLVEIETDKATVEVEAPASGLLVRVSAAEGEDVPVGHIIAVVLTPEEAQQEHSALTLAPATPVRAQENGAPARRFSAVPPDSQRLNQADAAGIPGATAAVAASLLAARIATEHQIDLSQVKSAGLRVQKADVLAYLQHQQPTGARVPAASPKARRLAREQGTDLATLSGSGPQGAILAADVLAAQTVPQIEIAEIASSPAVSTIWRIMAERTTQSWREVPHFYLGREVHAQRLVAWREYLMLERGAKEVTYTDLLVKIVALALRLHPRVNSSWHTGKITLSEEIHIGLAVAVTEGLVVPVIHHADRLGLRAIARERQELAARARAGKLRPADISGGTFTISNLGMYGVDTFNAIINQPQAAILAVGRIIERVVPVNGQPAVRPMMALTLSCDHRAVDGARGAQFLETLAESIEEPLGLLD